MNSQTQRRVYALLFGAALIGAFALPSRSIGADYASAPSPGSSLGSYSSVLPGYSEDSVGSYGVVGEPEQVGVASDGVLTGGVPELEDLQKQLDELRASSERLKSDFEAEKKKNKKEPKVNDPFTMKLSGHVSVDTALVSEDEAGREQLGNVQNSFSMRDLRVTMKGSGYGHLDYMFGFGVCGSSISLKDAYLKLKDTAYFGDVQVGHYFVESGMESVQATFERVFVSLDETSAMYSLYRRLGVSSTYFGADKRTRAFFGVFLGPSLSSSPHYGCENDPGLVLNARLTAAPICAIDEDGFAREVLHVGGSTYWFSPGGESKLRLRTRGQMWNGSNPYFFDGVVSLADTSYSMSQVETAYQIGGFAASGEGYFLNVYDGGGTAYGTSVVARLFLTPNCTRTYSKDKGRFGTIKMPEEAVFLNYKDRILGQHWGALEVVGKWEWAETTGLKNVIPASGGNTTGVVTRTVAGANWFWNEQAFLAANWEHAWATPRKAEKRLDTCEFDTLTLQMTFRF
ncbi:MAG: hypothetical protein IJM30_05835 [Thermoguttaceae bacterium]|nr:hypothetical protein [Thermoguttaceae bacterium]